MKKVFLIPPPALPVPAVKGGAVETLLTHLIEENERRQQLRLVCVSRPDPEAEAQAASYTHTRVFFVPHSEARGLWAPACGILRRLGRPAPLDPWYNRVKALVRREAPDLVVAEGGNLTEPQAIAALVGRSRMWAHLHMQIPCTAQTDAMYGGVLAISDFVARQWNSKTARVALVPNCVDTGLFSPAPATPDERACLRAALGLAPNDFAVLFCGRICPEKGVQKLVEALACLPDPAIKLVVVGSPFFTNQTSSPFFEQLKGLAQPHKDRICFTGFVPNEQMPAYYRAADLACFPALWEEPAGITAIEAMACGCPVLATRSGGMPEYLQGSGAVLLERDEAWDFGFTPVSGQTPLPPRLAQAILALKEQPEQRAAMTAAGVRRAAAFSCGAYYDAFVRALSEPAAKEEKTCPPSSL